MEKFFKKSEKFRNSKILKEPSKETKKYFFTATENSPTKVCFFRTEAHKKQPFPKTNMEAEKKRNYYFLYPKTPPKDRP